MNKPKRLYHQWRKVDYYEADEIDTYLTELLAPLKEVWDMYKHTNVVNNLMPHSKRLWNSIKQLAERLNW